MRTTTMITLALGIALTAAPSLTARADRVDVPLRTGSTESGVVERPGGVSSSAFLVLAGAKRKLSITVKRAKRSELLPVISVFDPDGNAVDFEALGGKAKAKPTSFKAKLKDTPSAGLWRVEVRGAEGSAGAYQITVKSKDTDALKGSVVVPLGGIADVPVTVGDGYSVTVAAKRAKGSRVIPDIQVVGPDGQVIAASVGAAAINTKKGTAKLKKFEVPTYGAYSVRFIGHDATGGGVAYSIKTSLSKYKGDRATAVTGPAFEVEPGLDATLDATDSRPSLPGRQWTPVWVQVGGPPVVLSDATSTRPTFVAPESETSLAFTLATTENGLPSRPQLIVVEIAPRPLADPGRSRIVAPGSEVTLDSRASFDRAARGLTSAWRVLEGDIVLDDPTSATPTFTAPATSGVVRVGLVVDDGRARSFEASQLIAVDGTAPSVADAGREQFVGRMATVHLSGLASTRPGGVLDGGATWTQIGGPSVDLAGADGYFPSFTAPREPVDLLFELRVDDAAATTHTTWVHVRPDESNTAPVTSINGPLVAVTSSVALDASPSFDVDSDPISLRWAAIDGAGASLSNPGAESPQATGLTDGAGSWIFAAQTRDDLQYGAPDTVRVIGPSYAGVPLANAGPNRSVAVSGTAVLDGSQSISTGSGELTFAWRQVSGADWYDVATSDPGFDPLSERPQFRLPPTISSLTRTRSLTFELTVADGNGSSAPDLATITFIGIALNSTPIATADASVLDPLPATVVTLIGTVVDLDGDPVTTTWTQFSGPRVDLNPNRNVLSPTFTTPSAGTLVFDLVGNDGMVDGAAARVTVVVDAKPVAVAEADPSFGSAGSTATIDGSGSSDPEGADLTYAWTQTGGAALDFDAAAESFQVQVPAGGMTFRLVVNDGRQDSDPVQLDFTHGAPPTVTPSADKAVAAYGSTVQLSAVPSDEDPATFVWRQINAGTDPVVTLSSTTVENPTFTVPLPTNAAFGTAPAATFGVIATRGDTSSVERTVVVSFFASFNDASLSATNRVYGIISANCSSCHSGTASSCPVGSGSNATGFGMGTASAFATNAIGTNACSAKKKRIQANNSGASLLMDRLSAGTMPPSGPISGQAQNLIRDWIDQGANTTR